MASLRIGLCIDPDAAASAEAMRLLPGSAIVVFPEMVDSGYAALSAGAAPHRLGDEMLARFAASSLTLAPYCIAGSVYLRHGSPSTSNTSLVFHNGRLIHRYDKIHLFRAAGDHRYFRPGKRIESFPLKLPYARLRCGVIICYDLRFPELARAMALQGIHLLVVPARWPSIRDDVWQTLLKARAIENQIFVVGCNALGEEGGYSYAFDPLGEMVFSSRTQPSARVHAFTIELDRIV